MEAGGSPYLHCTCILAPTIQSLCDLAVDYSHLTRQSSLKEQTLNIRASANWGKRLSTVKISYTEAFRGGQEEKKQVATALFKNKMVDVETILQYCE